VFTVTDENSQIAAELSLIFLRQVELLRGDRAALSRLERTVPAGHPDRRLLVEASAELERNIQRLRAVVDDLSVAARPWHLLNRAVFALRLAVAARGSLLRHTPPLAGEPRALHPVQCTGAGTADHFVEYARSGSRLFLEPGSAARIIARDHPLFADAGSQVAQVLYDAPPSAVMLFTSAMAAINTALDFTCHRARSRGRKVAVGQRSWMEVREYVRHEHGDVCVFFDESDELVLSRLLADPGVAGVCCETVVNHPSLPVVPLARAVRGSTCSDKIILVDCAHTPEFDPSRLWRNASWPGEMVLLAVVSGVKFLQAGLDISKSGLLSGWVEPGRGNPPSPFDELLELRERSGRVPSYEEAFLAALETRATFRARLARYDRNTDILARTLAQRLAGVEGLEVHSPWLEGHRDAALARAEFATGGRFVYLRLEPSRFPSRVTSKLDQRLCDLACSKGHAAMAACTFGLCVPHASLIVDVASPPALRLSPGSGAEADVRAVAELWADALARCAAGGAI
jgi:cystathionine beta-lyase/cystathionine gamma-synthase